MENEVHIHLNVMAKDPAFLFYYVDFLHGTRHMTREQKGLYIELMCEQADSKTGSIDSGVFKSITNCDCSAPVISKFATDSEGYYNDRLRETMHKRKKFTESRRKNLSSKTDSSEDNTHMDDHMDDHMGNRNRNRNKDVIKNVNEIGNIENPSLFQKITFSFWELFINNLKKLNIHSSDLSKSKAEPWVKAVRLMIESDKRTEHEINEVWNFLNNENILEGFSWSANIRSTTKLRQQFEKLLIAARRSNATFSHNQRAAQRDIVGKQFAKTYGK